MSKGLEEKLIERLLLIAGLTAVIVVTLIFLFLFSEGLAIFSTVSPLEFITGEAWFPTSNPPLFGVLPLILGSLIVTAGAIIVAVPLGVGSAIYIAEIAHPTLRETVKPLVEILAGIPSVVYGFFGLVILVPRMQAAFDLPTGQTALTGAIILGVMAIPTIVSISEDALRAVPRQLKEGALAMGATEWQTIRTVTVPAALSGIVAASILGVGRAIGETMTVLMVTGNAAVIPTTLLQPVRTLTATVALEMGEAPQGGMHYHALFAVAVVLFLLTFVVNLIADYVIQRYQERGY